MIKYALRCANRHGFEAWFRDSAAFTQQAERGLLSCPHCGDGTVTKAIMAPAVAKGAAGPGGPVEDSGQAASAPAAAPPAAQPAAALPSPAQTQAMAQMLAALRRHVEAECDPVGDRFADEARAIHLGEAEQRGIYGRASAEETAELLEEGIPVVPLPFAPHSH